MIFGRLAFLVFFFYFKTHEKLVHTDHILFWFNLFLSLRFISAFVFFKCIVVKRNKCKKVNKKKKKILPHHVFISVVISFLLLFFFFCCFCYTLCVPPPKILTFDNFTMRTLFYSLLMFVVVLWYCIFCFSNFFCITFFFCSKILYCVNFS